MVSWTGWLALLALPLATAFLPSPGLSPARLGPSRATSQPAANRARPFLANPRRAHAALWMADAEAGPYDAEDAAAMPAPPSGKSHETDFVVIGSGLGGLSAGAMLAKYGYKVTMCEAHYLPGGCAHGFEIKSKKDGGIYKFDAGPSLWAGMSQPSTNPLRQVMDAVGASVEWKQYTGWGVYFPDGYFRFNVGPANIPGGFEEVLQRFGAPGGGLKEWRTLIEKIKPLILSCTTFPPIALRADPGVLVTLRKQLPTFLSFGPVAAKINGPFSAAMQEAGIKDGTFLSHWLDYLSFALSGLLADGTICAAVSYTLGDLHRKGAVLDYPVGGSAAVCESLVESMENNGGTLMLRTPVEKILIENGKACGVVTKNGDTIRARKGVVSNVPIWGLGKLLPQEFVTKSWGGLIENSWKTQDTVKKFDATPQTESFMHLHLGIDAKGLKGLDIHYTVINDWEPGIDAAGNMIVISIPTVLDPSLAPDGKHVVHAYTAGNEPYSLFKGIDRKSDKYEELKRQRAQVLFEAVKRVIPDLDQRIEVELIGSPLTHERFLRRPQGTYGPAWAAGKDMFPGPGVASIPGLLCCGDSTFPGIGVPAVAASGLMAANTLVPLSQHLDLLERMKKEGLMPDQCMV